MCVVCLNTNENASFQCVANIVPTVVCMDLEKTNKMTGMALFKLRGTYLKAKSNNPVKQHLRKLNYRSENNFLLQEIYQYLSQTLIRCTLLFSLFTAKHKQICVQTHIHLLEVLYYIGIDEPIKL